MKKYNSYKDSGIEWIGEIPRGWGLSIVGRHFEIGRVISKVEIEDNKGKYPLYSSQTSNNGELGKINTYDFDEDFERIPLLENIDRYFDREVKPHLPNSWIDLDKNKVGYEINFTKYFYQYKPLRSLEKITEDLLALDKESENILKHILT